MECMHCGDPLPGPWHMPQEDPLPALRVGSLLDVTGQVSEELISYTFENVTRLAVAFGRGDFTPALGIEGHLSIFDRWFHTGRNKREAS